MTREISQPVFVDLEAANDAPDAIAEIAVQSKPLASVWNRTLDFFANRLSDASQRIDQISISELRVNLRAGIDAGELATQGRSGFRGSGKLRQTSSASH